MKYSQPSCHCQLDQMGKIELAQEPNHRHILSQTATEKSRGDIIDMIVIRLRIPDQDLQCAMPLSSHLQREDDHDREGRE